MICFWLNHNLLQILCRISIIRKIKFFLKYSTKLGEPYCEKMYIWAFAPSKDSHPHSLVRVLPQQRAHDVYTTSMQRHDVASTLYKCHVPAASSPPEKILDVQKAPSKDWSDHADMHVDLSSLVASQWAHNVKMTSYQRRCDVITSHRRWYDVILMLCACWVISKGTFSQLAAQIWEKKCANSINATCDLAFQKCKLQYYLYYLKLDFNLSMKNFEKNK